MNSHTISQKKYLEAAQLFHWATKEHFAMWFTGSEKRHRRTEAILPRLVKKGSLFATDYGKRLIYACPRRVRDPNHILKVEHGLGCTEGLVRFWWSNMVGEIIQERYFYHLGCVPEWGIRYPDGKMLLYEFCTRENFFYTNKLKSKLAAYRKYLTNIEDKYSCKAILVFVLDVEKEKVKEFVEEVKPVRFPVYYTDYQSFKSVPIGHQFSAPIYFWGKDGSLYPLIKNARPEAH